MTIPFNVADHGRNFTVLVCDDVVVKVPKRSKIENALNEIAVIQNELSDIDGILPCDVQSDCLVMPKATGRRGDTLTNREWEQCQGDVERIKSEAREMGYEIRGSARKNVFWDGEQAYWVDFSHVTEDKT